ncbi:hypothetical protein CDAR_400491 [Caerostris darwini]|uniref:Uncharacterized protein n=1 Tax=Caerostris darwini TaxID=1538125 RepID=A0AAV4P9Y7_9ARAC|nr:hypothetical protein CDAR_400491 [Caerostris darwini]
MAPGRWGDAYNAVVLSLTSVPCCILEANSRSCLTRGPGRARHRCHVGTVAGTASTFTFVRRGRCMMPRCMICQGMPGAGGCGHGAHWHTVIGRMVIVLVAVVSEYKGFAVI